jgi:uncharacterized protein (DUF2147 family)
MSGSNLRLALGGCGALALGLVGGWAVLTQLATKPPAAIEPIETTPTQLAPVPTPTSALPRDPPAAPPAEVPPPAPAASIAEKPRPATAVGPTGVWIDHTGRGAVEITECAGRLCGRIVWLKDTGHRSVCGTQVIGNAKRTSAGTWDGGWIYDPEKNARYSVELKPVGPDKLRVVGYVGSKLFSESFTWKRPTTELARCDAPRATASPSPAASDAKPSGAEITEKEPSPDGSADARSPGKSAKSGNPSFADLERVVREMMKGKPGGKGCTVKLPYIGTISTPCG